MGISTDFVAVETGPCLVKMLKEPWPVGSGAVLDLASLRHVLNLAQLEELRDSLRTSPLKLLLLTTEANTFTSLILSMLTGGLIHGVSLAGKPDRVSFLQNSEERSSELAGHSYARHPDEAIGLALNRASDKYSIVELGCSTTFVCIPLGKAHLFVWSTFKIINPLQPLSVELEFEETTDEYIPAIIFLRSAFGDRCWHNPHAAAAIVIDDPLLKRRYGLIDFPALLASAREHGYRITIAFIPWNSWRSSAKRVRVFREYHDFFSICVHGCDHTDNEYGSVDYDLLLAKNMIAVERMERHRQRTGLPYESIMVCPQEKYSMQAMKAFADAGQFLGLLNTSCLPRNPISPQVCAADLLVPAQDSLYGFPVFKRHYWHNMSPFAMDRFLGKPAILVEHHDFFRDGCAGIEHFAEQLSRLKPAVQWKPVSEIVVTTHSQRRVAEAERAIRFFATKLRFTHSGEAVTYHFSKRLPDSIAVRAVLVDGMPVPFSREADTVTFDLRRNSSQTFNVQIESPGAIAPSKAYHFGLKYQARVAVRRVLSEFRDNVISKSRCASQTSSTLIRAIKTWKS